MLFLMGLFVSFKIIKIKNIIRNKNPFSVKIKVVRNAVILTENGEKW